MYKNEKFLKPSVVITSTINPLVILLISKTHCLFKLIEVKLRELFKERYYLETKRHYKDNPLHGEFIIEMLGHVKFNQFETDLQASIKCGNVNYWKSDVLFVLLLSYNYKCVPIDKLNKENKVIERLKFIDDNVLYELHFNHSTVEQLNQLRDELTNLYLSIGGKKSNFNKALDPMNEDKTTINETDGINECIKINDKGIKLSNEGNIEQAAKEFEKGIYLCRGQNHQPFSFSMLSRFYYNLSMKIYDLQNQRFRNSETYGIDITFKKPIEKLKFLLNECTKLTPSWTKPWIRFALHLYMESSPSSCGLACKYIEVALLLDPDNKQLKSYLENFILDGASLLDDLKSLNRINNPIYKKLECTFYIWFGRKYYIANPFEIPLDIITEFNTSHSVKTTKLSLKSIQINNQPDTSKSLSIKYYNEGMQHKLEGKFELSFKAFCKSIIAGGDKDKSNKSDVPSSTYYQLGLMYSYGNSFIEPVHSIAVSLFYKGSIGSEGKDYYVKDLSSKNQKGRIESIYELAKLLWCGFHNNKSTQTALYWLRRINSIDVIGIDKNKSFTSGEVIAIGKALHALGAILLKDKPTNSTENEIDLVVWKINNNGEAIKELSNSKKTDQEAFDALSKGYLHCHSLDCLHLLEEHDPIQADKLKFKKQSINNEKISRIIHTQHSIGKLIYFNDRVLHKFKFFEFSLEYIKIKKFAQHPTNPSIQSQRIISCLDFVNLFINNFISSSSLKENEQSIKYLADAFITKELHVLIKLPDDVMSELFSFLKESITGSINPSKELSIVWCGCNCFNHKIKTGNDENLFFKRNNEMLEFIKQSIIRFPNDLIFKFFSSIYNRYNGKLDDALDDLNYCITTSNLNSAIPTFKYCPSSSDIYYYYKADTLFYLKRNQESIDAYNEYLIKSPPDARWRMESYYTIAFLKHDPNNPIQNQLNLKIAKESESKSLYCFLPWFSVKF